MTTNLWTSVLDSMWDPGSNSFNLYMSHTWASMETLLLKLHSFTCPLHQVWSRFHSSFSLLLYKSNSINSSVWTKLSAKQDGPNVYFVLISKSSEHFSVCIKVKQMWWNNATSKHTTPGHQNRQMYYPSIFWLSLLDPWQTCKITQRLFPIRILFSTLMQISSS